MTEESPTCGSPLPPVTYPHAAASTVELREAGLSLRDEFALVTYRALLEAWSRSPNRAEDFATDSVLEEAYLAANRALEIREATMPKGGAA